MMTATKDTLRTNQLKKRFAHADGITIDELRDFYREVPQPTLYVWLRKLVGEGVLQRIGRGLYRLGNETFFYPELSENDKRIYGKIRKNFPYAKACVWNTDCLNEFTRHQPGKYNLLTEVEKDVAESVFYFMKEQYKDVFLNPTKEVYHKYIAGQKQSIIVMNLISEAPLQEIEGVSVPTIEKILVDLLADKSTFSAFQGNEMRNIFLEAIEKYTVSWTTLNRYAERRNKKKELNQYIKSLNLRQK